MTAGLPGLGLNGLFVILCTLAIPLRRSSPPASRRGRLVAMAVVISVATLALWHFGLAALTHGPTIGLGVPAIVVTLGILGMVLLVPELQYRVQGTNATPTPPPVIPYAMTELFRTD
jgi:hypothetical protein